MQRIDDMRRRLLKVSAELRSANRALERMSRQDGLTELANRRYFDTFLADEMARPAAPSRSCASPCADVHSSRAQQRPLYLHIRPEPNA